MNRPIFNPSSAVVSRLAGMVLSLAWVLGFSSALADEGGRFANFDQRTGAAPPVAAARREDAAASIRARVRKVRVERNRITDTPAFIGSPHEFLSGPAGTGKAVPAAAIAAIPGGDPHRGIKALNVTAVAILAVEPPDDFAPAGVPGGPFVPPSKSYALTNTGQSPLHWTTSSSAPWVALFHAGGTLAAGASTTVTATIQPKATALDPGTYNATINFTNNTTGVGNTTRAAALTLETPVPELNAMPLITGGTTSTVSWNFLPGADLYEVQYDSTPAFANPVSSSLIVGTSHTFTGLGDGTLHNRVRARRLLSADPVTWTQTSEGDFSTGTANGVSLGASPGDVILASQVIAPNGYVPSGSITTGLVAPARWPAGDGSPSLRMSPPPARR